MAVSQPLLDEEFLTVLIDHELTIDTNIKSEDFSDGLADCVLEEEWLDSLALENILSSPGSTTDNDNDALTVTVPKRNTRISLKSSRYRNRKREELQSLRDAVQTLQVRLAALKSMPAATTETPGSSHRIWEAIAQVESEQRQAAEHKNRELREMVALHYQLAQKLEDVLSKVSAHCG